MHSFDKASLAKRHQLLFEQLPNDAAVIIPASNLLFRNGDAHYPFRQNSDFLYLTGIEEPTCYALFLKTNNSSEYILFNREADPMKERWDGPMLGQDKAKALYGIDQAFPIEQFQHMLPELLNGVEVIYTHLDNRTLYQQIIKAKNKLKARVRKGNLCPDTLRDIGPLIAELRVIKSEEELACIQKAVDISVMGHQKAMRVCQPGLFEYQLEAELLHTFCQHGARHLAYTSIVGSGANTCILHYIENNQAIQSGDLVLIDAGAEFQNYASDITRTFPANGHFTGEQRAVYGIVLEAQEQAIQAIKPGVTWDHISNICIKVITQGLVDIRLLKGDVDALIEDKSYEKFYMHQFGHWLGLDVHDVGSYKQHKNWRSLESHMVFTVEPGIYIDASLKEVDARWHHIGVRIEDDICVTHDSAKVLSQALVKHPDEIEKLMQN